MAEAGIVAALRVMARQGIFLEPASAAAVAALDRLLESRALSPRETTVVLLTGTGVKAAPQIAALLEGAA